MALPPDGQILAVNLIGQQGILAVRSLASDKLRLLTGTEFARNPFWSADGESIAFLQDQKLKIGPASGGPVEELHAADRKEVGTAPGVNWRRIGR